MNVSWTTPPLIKVRADLRRLKNNAERNKTNLIHGKTSHHDKQT